MAVRGTPESIQAKWVTRISGATQEISAGVDRVTQAPGAAAAAKADKWLANVMSAKDKWKRNVGAVSLDDWKTYMKNVGVPRIAQGAQAKQNKVGNFLRDFIPHLERGIESVNRMPDVTFEDRVQKAVAMMRHNRNFRRTGGTGGA
jgi:hypothetical protein